MAPNHISSKYMYLYVFYDGEANGEFTITAKRWVCQCVLGTDKSKQVFAVSVKKTQHTQIKASIPKHTKQTFAKKILCHIFGHT